MTRNNFLKTGLLLVMGAAAACGSPQQSVKVVQVTFDVTVPQDTPASASVYIIGNHPNLGGDSNDAGLKLHRDSATKFKGIAYLPAGTTVLYRVRLKDPSAAELNAAGSAVEPHALEIGDADATDSSTVMQWDVPKETVHPKVTFVVNVPSNTPSDAKVYLAGDQPEMGPWNPGFYALTKGADGKYRGTIQFAANPGTAIQFKATRGTWDVVEKNADGSELATNRAYTLPATATATTELTVARWADLAAP